MRTDHLNKSAKAISAKKRTHKRWMRVVSTLAAITVFCTTYALILPAITISANTHCGLEEHEHTDECYERQLVCGFDDEGNAVTPQEGEAAEVAPTTEIVTESVLVDAGHIHDESCYNVETTLICENTEEDHEHTEACYEEVQTLVCGEEEREAVYEEREVEVPVEAPAETVAPAEAEAAAEADHVHTDECYEKVLICGKEEHKHTDGCFSNSDADLETAEIWERTLPEKSEMKDEWKEDTLLVAQSQIGYKESEANFVVVNEERKGYTRYGEMFGVPYGDWCAMFLQFSLHYAGVDTRAMVGSPSVPLWVEAEIENENFYKVGEKIKDEETGEEKEYMPKATDIIFFDWENDGSPDHVGIIEEIKMDENDETKIDSIITIEGNSQNEVRRNTYKSNYEHIYGYSEIPDKMTEEELQALAEGKPLPSSEEAKKPRKEYVGVDGELVVDEDDYTVTVTYTAEAGIPEGATLQVSEILQDTEEYSIYNDKSAEEIYGKNESLLYARFFDITILDEEGLEVEPVSTVSVVIDTKDDALQTEDVKVAAVHFVDENKQAAESAEAAETATPAEESATETVTPAEETATEATEAAEAADSETAEEEAAAQETPVETTEPAASTSAAPVDPAALTTTVLDVVTSDVVSFDTDGFSVYGVVIYYTVDFYYTFPADDETTEEVEVDMTEYHMPGGSEMMMSELFTKLQIERNTADIANVEFTNYELVTFTKEDDDYRIKSLIPFLSHEMLTITFNDGEVLEIAVDDAQVNGKNKKIDSWTDLKVEIDWAFNRQNKSEVVVSGIDYTFFGANQTITVPDGKTLKIIFKEGTTIGKAMLAINTNLSGIASNFGPFFSVGENATLEIENATFTGRQVFVEGKDVWANNKAYRYPQDDPSGLNRFKKGDYAGVAPYFSWLNTDIANSVAGKGYFIDSYGTTVVKNTVFKNINSNEAGDGPRDLRATANNELVASNFRDTAPIYSHKGSLTVNNSTFENNYLFQSPDQNSNAGAIIANGSLNITNSQFKNNGANGGVIIHNSGNASISGTTIDGNVINGADAAPIVSKSGSTMTLNNTNIKNNLALYPRWEEAAARGGNNEAFLRTDDFDNFFTYLSGLSLESYGGKARSTPYTQKDNNHPYGGYFYGDTGLSVGDPDSPASSVGSSTGYLNNDPTRTAGAVLVSGGNVTMNGGSMSYNMGDHGAVLVTNGGTFTQNSGSIDHNKGYHAGAVAMAGNGGTNTYNLNGGELHNNLSIWYGTVNVSEQNSRFTMGVNGGNPTIRNNFTLHKGAGIYVNSSNTDIKSGTIKDNTAAIFGGGIYLERYRDLKLQATEIHHNTATSNLPLTKTDGVAIAKVSGGSEELWKQAWWSNLGSGLGGGVWSCPTGRTSFDNTEVAIYQNTASTNGGQDFSIRDHGDKLTFRTNETWVMENAPLPAPRIAGTVTQNPTDPAFIPTEGKKEIRFTNSNHSSVAGNKTYNLVITGNAAPCGGGIASNGNLGLIDKKLVDANINFEKTYATGAPVHRVRVTVTLIDENSNIVQIEGENSKTLYLNETNNWKASMKLPAVLEATEGSAAYAALNNGTLTVGDTKIGKWTIRVKEEVDISNDNSGKWIDAAEQYTVGLNKSTLNKDDKEFSVTYNVKASLHNVPSIVPKAEWQPQVTKSFTTNDETRANEEFTFALYAASGENFVLGDVIERVTVQGSGTASFAKIQNLEPGTYRYVMKEVIAASDEEVGMTFDRSEKRITVVVTRDANDETKAVATVTGNNPTFNNTYTKPQQGELVIQKVDQNGVALPGATFEVWSFDGYTHKTITASGDGSVFKIPGNVSIQEWFSPWENANDKHYYNNTLYFIKEVSPPDAATYKPLETVIPFKLSVNETTGDISFVPLTHIGAATNGSNEVTGDPNAIPSNQWMIYSNSNGITTLKKSGDTGGYSNNQRTEREVINWNLIGSGKQVSFAEFQSGDKKAITYTVSNEEKQNPGITVQKIDESGNPIPGAVFKIRPIDEPNNQKTFTDQGNGIHVYGQSGTERLENDRIYTIWESTAPKVGNVSYETLGIDIPIKVSANGTVTILAADAEFPIDSDMYPGSKNVLGPWRTAWAKLYNGNSSDTNNMVYLDTSGSGPVIKIKNIAPKELLITKVDNSSDASPVIGAKFRVEEVEADGNDYKQVAGTQAIITNSSTNVHRVTGLETGKLYRITEYEAPEGYNKNYGSVVIRVNNNGFEKVKETNGANGKTFIKDNTFVTTTDSLPYTVGFHVVNDVTGSLTVGKELEVATANGTSIYGNASETDLFKFEVSILKDGGLNTWRDGVTFSVYENGRLIQGELPGFTIRTTSKPVDNQSHPLTKVGEGYTAEDPVETWTNAPSNLSGIGNGIRDVWWLSNDGNTANMTFYLKAGQTVTFNNLPLGATWTVKEVNLADKYDFVKYTKDGQDAKIGEGDTATLIPQATGISGSITKEASSSTVIAHNREDTGELKIKKEIINEGFVDNDSAFTFEVTIGENGTPTQHIVKAGETKPITNLPIGATWKVKEISIPSNYELKGYRRDTVGENNEITEGTLENTEEIQGTVGKDNNLIIVARNEKTTCDIIVTKSLIDEATGEELTYESDSTLFTITGNILKADGTPYATSSDQVTFSVLDKDGHVIEEDIVGFTIRGNGMLPGSVDTYTKQGGGEETLPLGVRRTYWLGTGGNTKNMEFYLKAGQSVIFENVPVGATWNFSEASIPGGYSLTAYEVNDTETVNKATPGGSISENSTEVNIVNSKKLPKLKILKVDGSTISNDNPTPLQGAEFQIYADLDSLKQRITWLENGESGNGIGDWYFVNVFAERKPAGYTGDYNGWWNHTVNTYQHKMNNNLFDAYGFQLGSNGRMLDDNGQLIRYMPCYRDYESTKNYNKVFTSGADGIVDFGELPDGTYKIVEKKAPAGYNTLSGAITVVISNGEIISVSGADTNASNIQQATESVDSDGYKVYTFAVPNTSGASLPNTGGIGTVIFTALGAVLVIGAAIALLATRKRRG